MPGMSGTELLRQISVVSPHTYRMILSAYDDFTLINQALKDNIVHKFLTKPWSAHEILNHLHEAFNRYERVKALSELDSKRLLPLDCVVITDEKHIVCSVNQQFNEVMGYPIEMMVNRFFSLFDRTCTSDEKIFEVYASLVRYKMWNGELWFKKHSGNSGLVYVSVAAVCNDRGNIMRYIYSFFEITPSEKVINT
jgi:response regulator RpfG family c-di-GMP phosphodiesterase